MTHIRTTREREFSRNGILLTVITFVFATFSCFAQESGYYFFDEEDIQNIRTASGTAHGQKILSSLKEQVQERRQHSLRVPLLEGGHVHHYFCPIHNLMFTFDWDSPHRHYCSLCGSHWENVNRYDWAWINGVHGENLKYLTASMYLYLATSDTLYAGYIRDMMLDYASKYPTYFEHNVNRVAINGSRTEPGTTPSGRMFAQSLDEAVWASDAARAYWVAKPMMTAAEIHKIENGYLNVCAQMLLNRHDVANRQMWRNSGLAALGVALQNDKIIQAALDDYNYLMNRHVYDDGWWNEGSPAYHFYPLRAILLTADALRCRNINLFDKKLYNMLAAPARGVYANLTFPAHNDGWYGESLIQHAPLYEIACQRYKDVFFADFLKAAYNIEERTSPLSLLNGMDISAGTEKLSLKSICFENTGVAILRSNDKAVVLKYGPYGDGGHGHPDKLSISLFDGKEELLTDMGTSGYGAPDYHLWYRKTISHSTVTVDGKDQSPVTGQLVSFKPSNNGGYVEAKVEDVYPGVEMTRSLNLQGNHLTDITSCASNDIHTYDYVLMLTQKPQFTEKGELTIISNIADNGRITDTEVRKVKRQISCRIEGAEINIQLLSGSEFEVITGKAPGIPPRLGITEYAEKPVYPLLIRVKDKHLKIKTEWKIKN